MKTSAILVALSASMSASAYTITFKNQCSYGEYRLSCVSMRQPANLHCVAVWPAVGKAPNGQVDNSVRFGAKLNPGQSVSWNIDGHQLVRENRTTHALDVLMDCLGHPRLGAYGLRF